MADHKINFTVWPSTVLRWDYSTNKQVYLNVSGTTVPPHSKPTWEQLIVSVSRSSSFKPEQFNFTKQFMLSSIPDYENVVKVFAPNFTFQPLKTLCPVIVGPVPTISSLELIVEKHDIVLHPPPL